MNPTFPVKLVEFKNPIGNVGHALIKCPRCLRNIGVTENMLLGIDSIICKGALGDTGFICNGHYYYDKQKEILKFIGTVH